MSVTPTAFERQIERLLARGYEPVTFAAAADAAADDLLLAITFDDAYRSVIERALPILDAAGAVATVFAPTAFVGSVRAVRWPGVEHWSGTEHEDELAPMSWSELAVLADAGWEIGSHSHTHPRLVELDDDGLSAELRESKLEIEQALGRPCRSLAYPYGSCDPRVVAAAAAAGYKAAAQLDPVVEPGPLAIPRLGLYRNDVGWRFRAKLNPSATALRRAFRNGVRRA
jgi:peptidoglycan/xylan/chitin deacetylase (PgdA/CDA1 family)